MIIASYIITTDLSGPYGLHDLQYFDYFLKTCFLKILHMHIKMKVYIGGGTYLGILENLLHGLNDRKPPTSMTSIDLCYTIIDVNRCIYICISKHRFLRSLNPFLNFFLMYLDFEDLYAFDLQYVK